MEDPKNMPEESYGTEEFDTVTLTLDDESELECAILGIYPAGDHDYIALLPLTKEGTFPEEDEQDVLLYRFIDNGPDEDPEIENIEDDDEYALAADAFDELLDEEAFEELPEE